MVGRVTGKIIFSPMGREDSATFDSEKKGEKIARYPSGKGKGASDNLPWPGPSPDLCGDSLDKCGIGPLAFKGCELNR